MSSVLAQLSVVFLGMTVLVAPFAVMAEDVPDALSVEWQGQKPCEKLFEDDQVRISHCSFPPGATQFPMLVTSCHGTGGTSGVGDRQMLEISNL
jgi:hypothetical protein